MQGQTEFQGCYMATHESEEFAAVQAWKERFSKRTNGASRWQWPCDWVLFVISLKRKRKDSTNPKSFLSLGYDWYSSQPRSRSSNSDSLGRQYSSRVQFQDEWTRGRNMINSIFTTNFKGDYFRKERKDMLRQRNWNQYTHGDGFRWNKKKVHCCINSKFPCLKMVFRRSIDLMDYSHSHRTTLGLFYPGEMIDLSHCEFSLAPFWSMTNTGKIATDKRSFVS